LIVPSCERTSTPLERQKKSPSGRSDWAQPRRTELVDALGNPLAFLLTPGQAHNLDGADVLLPQMQADILLADKAFDADKRVIEPLLAAGKTPVIPSMPGRKSPRPYDRALFAARHLIENFFCKLKQFRACNALRQAC
jgi:transposase